MKYINTTQSTYTKVEDTYPNATATIIAAGGRRQPPQGDPLEKEKRNYEGKADPLVKQKRYYERMGNPLVKQKRNHECMWITQPGHMRG